MSIKKVTIEIPAETYQKFRVECAKKQSTIKDEMLKLMCASLDVIEEPKKAQSLEDDLEEPYVEPSIKKEDLEAELKHIREEISTVQLSVNKFNDNIMENFNSWVQAVVKKMPETCPKLEQFEEIKKHFIVTAKLIDSVMSAVEKTSSAKKCEDDRKGLEYLKEFKTG